MSSLTVSDFLKITSNKLNFVREKYVEKNIPNNFDQICIFFNIGDLRSTISLSSMLLPRFRKETKSLRYFIVFGYPGFSALYPYADEYWSFDPDNFAKVYNSSSNHDNNSEFKNIYLRHLNENFREVIKADIFLEVYNNFFLNKFWEKNKNIRIILPQVINNLANDDAVTTRFNELKNKRRLFIFPNKTMQIIRKGNLVHQEIKQEFWVKLAERLLQNNIDLICVKHYLTHDISSSFTDNNNILFFNEKDINKIMSLMRMAGITLDFFSGISRMSNIARVPFILVDERIRYFNHREYEFEDVIGNEVLDNERFFIFADLININNDLYNNIAGNIISKIDKILNINNGVLYSEYSDKLSSYQNVRYHQSKKMGLKFLKFPKVN